MAAISLRLSDRDNLLIRKYAEIHGLDLSTFIRQAVIDRIEDEYDLSLFYQVWDEEQTKDRISHAELKRELGL